MKSVKSSILSRTSTRQFLADKIPPVDMIKDLLRISSYSPSGGNLQPWKVYLVEGMIRDELIKKIEDKMKIKEFSEGEKTQYHVYPPDLKQPYRSRRSRCGEQLYQSIGIPKSEREKKSSL